MIRVTSLELIKDAARYQDAALARPVIVTREGRDPTALISADEYRRLKRRDRDLPRVEDFSDADIEGVRAAEPSQKAEAFDHEYEQ